MKRIFQIINTIGIIFTISIAIVIVIHLMDTRSMIEVKSLLHLLIIVCATQIVSVIMDHIIIKPIWLHMLAELLIMEGFVLLLGYTLGIFESTNYYFLIINILIIAFVYIFTVLYYWISARYVANEINQYLQNKQVK